VSRKRFADAVLMHLIAQGDEQAFSLLYDRYKAAVFGLACQMVGDASAAEEITLDVFVQIWRHASSYRHPAGSVRTWLTAIARHKAIDRLRREKSRPDRPNPQWADADLEALPDGIDPEADLAEREQRGQVIRAIGALPEEQKQPLGLAYFKGYSHSQIAHALDLPLGTVKTRIRAAMQHLKGVLGRDQNGPTSKVA